MDATLEFGARAPALVAQGKLSYRRPPPLAAVLVSTETDADDRAHAARGIFD